MRSFRATDGSGPAGGAPGGDRLTPRGGKAKTRQPGDLCGCGHRRSTHRWGGKACRHVDLNGETIATTKAEITIYTHCDCQLFTNPRGVL